MRIVHRIFFVFKKINGYYWYTIKKELVLLRAYDKFWKEYYTTMEPMKVEKNTVFVLEDTCWRSDDSRSFEVLKMQNVEVKILGFKK